MANIQFAFVLNFGFALIEVVAGFWIGSLAVVANAIHDLGDSVSLAAAWFLERLANRHGDRNFNFGYKRFSLLSALISGAVISVGSVFIVVEAIKRFNTPHLPNALPMMAFAGLGLAVNAIAAWRMSHGETHNEKVLTWHLIEDVMGWATVLVGGLLVKWLEWTWIDPVLAIALAVFVCFNVVRYLKQTAYLFLQGRPRNFDEALFMREALAVKGVELLDHLAVWSLDGETSVLSARLHIHQVHDPMEIEQIKQGVREAAKRQKAQATLETCLAEAAPHEHDHHHHGE
jgi:cobalt-zinc-cadmium efflux system protein